MNFIRSFVFTAVAALATHAMAQSPANTGEARALAAQATAAFNAERAFERPVLETVAPGDYRAAARNQGRMARFATFHRDLEAYLDGARSAPIHVDSYDTAQEEAGRRSSERAMAKQAAFLQGSPSAQAMHRAVMEESGAVAMLR